MGIEPTSEAWEASILPLYDARSIRYTSIILKNLSLRTDATRIVFSVKGSPAVAQDRGTPSTQCVKMMLIRL